MTHALTLIALCANYSVTKKEQVFLALGCPCTEERRNHAKMWLTLANTKRLEYCITESYDKP